MASLSSLISTPSPNTTANHPKPFPLSAATKLPTHSSHLRSRSLNITCNATSDQENNNPTSRRDLLLGIGGAAAAAATTFTVDPSFARPIKGPSIDTCVLATAKQLKLQCCPPSFAGKEIADFQLPSASEPLRIRRPAHLASKDPEYVTKYEKAIKAMKCLPNDDPRSYVQQARVHCAYCNGSYVQADDSNKGLQIHYSWLFLPFHRYYMYFYERILGKLIGDPTFAIPFWNWDHEDGMAIADMFLVPESPLYDPLRNPNHVIPPSNLLDLDWNKIDVKDRTKEEQVRINYAKVYKNMVSGAKKRSEFFGAKYRAGSDVPERASSGSCENLHNPAHIWVGDNTRSLGEDMGNFYSSGRDPLFYVHHGNVDRMWNVWKDIGKFRFDFDDYDYLNASFLFYDENANPVRVKVKDSLDNKLMRYDYEERPLPWRNFKPTPAKAATVARLFGGEKEANASPTVELTPLTEFPLALDKVTSVSVARPKKSRSAAEKEAKSEVLVVYGIELEGDKVVKFDVVVNDDPAAPSTPDKSEYAGSFLNVPHDAMKFSTNLRLDITELVDDIGAGDDDELVVTLVPRIKDGPVTIAGVRIELQGP
ncbi:Polyphenol oxidase latent form, chloroplastic [Linum grandiflorum]